MLFVAETSSDVLVQQTWRMVAQGVRMQTEDDVIESRRVQ